MVFHDGNTLASQVADCLGQAARDEIANFDVEAVAADLVVVVADLRNVGSILKLQKDCLQAARPFLLIGLEPGFLWIGPYVTGRQPGCFRCLTSWLQNNYRDANHWSDPGNFDVRTARRLLPPMPQPLSLAVRQLLLGVLANHDTDHTLANAVVRFDLRRALTSRHTYIANAYCPDCSAVPPDEQSRGMLALEERPKIHPDRYRAANDRLSVESLRARYVDRHTGMVKHVFNSLNSDLMPMYTAELPIMYSEETESGYGRQETGRGSEMVSILETLERYAGHMPRGARASVRASYREVKDRAIDPRSLILHEPGQYEEPGFRLERYTEDLEYNWIWGYSFKNERPVLVPEQCVYYYLLDAPDRPTNRFVYETSNGCALGGSREEAAFYGLLELVERDAYLTTWYGRFTPAAIDLRRIDDQRIRHLLVRGEAQGLDLFAFDVRQDINVPVVWCMVVDPEADAPVKSYCAAGASFLPEDAVYSALVEVMTSIGVYQKSMPPLRERAVEMFHDGSKVQAMHDHVLLYSLPDTFERLQFLFGREACGDIGELYGDYERPRHSNLTDDLRWLVDRVMSAADDVIVVDQGFPELADSGLHSVKVIAPGLLPVSFGNQYRRVSLRRANQAAAARGLPRFGSVGQLNPYPHNFP